jgi:hypothetical protein
VTTNPRHHILIYLDHEEKQNAVYKDHAENDWQINPLGPIHIDLENVFKNEIPRDLGLIRVLVVENKTIQVILALALLDL